MTVIVSLKHDSRVYIGGDRNRSAGNMSFLGSNPKVWCKSDSFGNKWLFGQAGTCSLQQIAQYLVPLPEENVAESKDICGFLFERYLPMLYEKAKGFGGVVHENGKGENLEGSLILGLLGNIYDIAALAVTKIDNKFHTLGLGGPVAHGVLDAIHRHNIELSPEEKIQSAILAAESRFPSIGGGMDIVSD